MSIEFKWDDIVLSLCSGGIVVDDSSIDFIVIGGLLEEIDSESLDSGGFGGSDDSQPMCIDNDGVFSSNVLDDVINIWGKVVEI